MTENLKHVFPSPHLYVRKQLDLKLLDLRDWVQHVCNCVSRSDGQRVKNVMLLEPLTLCCTSTGDCNVVQRCNILICWPTLFFTDTDFWKVIDPVFQLFRFAKGQIVLKKYPIMLFKMHFFPKRTFNAEINAGIMCDTLPHGIMCDTLPHGIMCHTLPYARLDFLLLWVSHFPILSDNGESVKLHRKVNMSFQCGDRLQSIRLWPILPAEVLAEFALKSRILWNEQIFAKRADFSRSFNQQKF